MQDNSYWPYVSNLAGSFLILPLRKNLLGSKRKANNCYFSFTPQVRQAGKQFATPNSRFINPNSLSIVNEQ